MVSAGPRHPTRILCGCTWPGSRPSAATMISRCSGKMESKHTGWDCMFETTSNLQRTKTRKNMATNGKKTMLSGSRSGLMRPAWRTRKKESGRTTSRSARTAPTVSVSASWRVPHHAKTISSRTMTRARTSPGQYQGGIVRLCGLSICTGSQSICLIERSPFCRSSEISQEKH